MFKFPSRIMFRLPLKVASKLSLEEFNQAVQEGMEAYHLGIVMVRTLAEAPLKDRLRTDGYAYAALLDLKIKEK